MYQLKLFTIYNIVFWCTFLWVYTHEYPIIFFIIYFIGYIISGTLIIYQTQIYPVWVLAKIISARYLRKIANKLHQNQIDQGDTIKFKNNHVEITYYLNKTEYLLRLPYYKMNQLKLHEMILVKSLDGAIEEIDITHKHGIPYFLTACDLGGSHIEHRKTGDLIKCFNHEKVPHI